MSWVEIVGYVASGLVLATFYMKTMVPLRYCAIASNGAFIAYGFFAAIYPVLVLHLLLLPLNVKRLLEIRQMIKEITRASTAGFSFEAMIPFMTKRTFRAGHALFRQGDTATNLYILCQGSVRLPEIAVTVTDRGALIGEIGLFSPSHERTTSAICETDVVALTLTQDKVVQLYYQNPRFGFALVQLVIQPARGLVRLERPGGRRAPARRDRTVSADRRALLTLGRPRHSREREPDAYEARRAPTTGESRRPTARSRCRSLPS